MASSHGVPVSRHPALKSIRWGFCCANVLLVLILSVGTQVPKGVPRPVVKSTIFSGLNVVEIETENGETLQIAGRHLEKTKLPKAIVDMAMVAVKARMAEKCPMKDGAPCLS